jgi:Ala-tRNA(Pro) deacylase
MSSIAPTLTLLLDRQGVAYEIINHRRDYTAQETAAHTHTPGREFAKTVLLWIDGSYALVVLPAHHKVDLLQLRHALGARQIKFATEEEMAALCPDCEAGAIPPFGNAYGIPVYMSTALIGQEFITFNAGTHTDVIRMRQRDYGRLAHPRVITCSHHVNN